MSKYKYHIDPRFLLEDIANLCKNHDDKEPYLTNTLERIKLEIQDYEDNHRT